MSAPKSQLASGLAMIWQRHQQLVHQRAAFIADAVILLKLNQLTPDLREEAGEDAHKLAGNLGTFGHPTGSEHARALELKLLSGAQLDSSDVQQLDSHVQAMRSAIQEIAQAMASTDSARTATTAIDAGAADNASRH
jgi:HPt (histidine-containing phosphotransfer) domain-containing protein